jgi:hypothetical protein
VPAADTALKDGSVDVVVGLLTDAVRKGVHEHFHSAVEHKISTRTMSTPARNTSRRMSLMSTTSRSYGKGATGETHEHRAGHAAYVHLFDFPSIGGRVGIGKKTTEEPHEFDARLVLRAGARQKATAPGSGARRP